MYSNLNQEEHSYLYPKREIPDEVDDEEEERKNEDERKTERNLTAEENVIRE